MESEQIKVLSLCTSDVAGGAARAAMRIHQGVRALGVDSRMFVKDKGSDLDSVVPLNAFVPKHTCYRAYDWCLNKVKNKVQHHRWNRYPDKDQNFKSDLRGVSLHGALRKIDYEVLHLHWVNQRFLKLNDLKKVNKPILWTLHDSWPFCGVCHYFLECRGYQTACGRCPQLASSCKDDLSHRLWVKKKACYKDIDLHIVTPSKWLADCARQSSLFGGLDINVIPNCLDTDVFSPTNHLIIDKGCLVALEKRFEKPVVLYGAVNAATDRIKGFANLLSAMKIIEGQGNAEFELVVFGAKDEDLPTQIKDLHIPITSVGYVNDTEQLVSLYRQASVMVVPSLTENLSCAIMESMSCGTPVVAFNVGGNGDMIEHKKNGYLARELDDEDLANGIMWCLENNDDNALGMAAREKVLRNYCVETVSEQYRQMYQKVLHERLK